MSTYKIKATQMKIQHSTQLSMTTMHPAIWGCNDEKSDLLAVFMETYSMDLYSDRKIYWIINFHFLLLRKIKKSKRYFTLPICKKVKVFFFRECDWLLYCAARNRHCQPPRKRSFLYCLRTKVLFRGRRKDLILRAERKKGDL